jgi:hypothetical protein
MNLVSEWIRRGKKRNEMRLVLARYYFGRHDKRRSL